jgi:hypothetical protein
LKNGRTAGSINLGRKTEPGNYVIRAYTQWMQNYGKETFFYKPIKILNILEGIDHISSKPVADNLLKVAFDKKSYKIRSKVKITLSLDSTSLNNLVQGSFSISVFDESLAVNSTETTTIKSDFDLPESAVNKISNLSYSIENGITLEGIYQDKKGKDKKTKLTFLPENMGGIYQTTTSVNGKFTIKNLVFYDSTKFVVQPSEGKILLTNKDFPPLPEKLPVLNLPVKPLNKAHISFSDNDSLRTNLLEEFNVKGKKTVKSENSYAQADFYIKGESMGNFASTAEAIAAKVPGLKLIFDSNNWFLVWARGTITGKDGRPAEPNLYVDNVMVVGETAGNRLFQINPAMIDHIEVNGMITANQGANGANGLVNVFTRKTNEVPSRDLSFFKAKGFDRAAIFPSPNYEDPALNSVVRDNRSTLYWNPEINILSPQTPVEVSFYTSDLTGNYRIVIEGITNRGNTIRSESVFSVTD